MPSRINRFFYNVLEFADIDCKFHSLRHTHITQLLEGGVNLKTIQERVGHTQISTTMIYCHPDKAKDQEAASLFEKFM
jgi:site-specific recombinase XerD